jgi:hypothetical protein
LTGASRSRARRAFPDALTWLAVGLAAAAVALLARIGADALWLAALGRDLVESGSIPAGVPYAAAPSGGWVNGPVLGEIVFHGLESGLGDRGLILAQALAAAAAFTLLARDMQRAGTQDVDRAFALLLVVFASLGTLVVVRAQLFSIAFFPVLVLLLRAEARAPSRRLWLLVPLLALWSNLHGGALVGLAVAACYLLFDRVRREPFVATTVLAASALALFLTPSFLHTGHYYLGVLGNEAAARGLGLWAPLSLDSLFPVLFVLAGVPLALAALRVRPPVWELVALAGLGLATVHAARNGIWFAFFAATPAALGVRGARPRGSGGRGPAGGRPGSPSRPRRHARARRPRRPGAGPRSSRGRRSARASRTRRVGC